MNPFNLESPEFNAIRYQVYKELRQKEPVYWYEPMQSWLIMKHDDTMSLLKSETLSTNYLIKEKLKGAGEDLNEATSGITNTISQWMIYNDPPVHTRLRKYMSKVFTRQHVMGLKPVIHDIIRQKSTVLNTSSEFDFVKNFAHPVPAQILCNLIGLNEINLNQFLRWSDAIAFFMQDFVVAPTPNGKIAEETYGELQDMKLAFRNAIETRKHTPMNDLLTDLVAGIHSYEEGITEDELILQLIHLIFGGHKIPQFVMSNFLHCLMTNEEYMTLLLSKPDELMYPTVEEVMRYESPIQFITRHAKEDFELRGKKIKKGDSIYLMLGSANRDEEVFDCPEKFNPLRTKGHHISFGGGVHTCIAASLVNEELKQIFGQLLKDKKGIKACYDLQNPDWTHNATFHGINSQSILLNEKPVALTV
jgi:cytochrome P450